MLRKLTNPHFYLSFKALNHFNSFYFANSQTRSPASIFSERSLLNQSSSELLQNPDFVNKIKEENKFEYLSAYVGYDPTADSLHLGNMLSIVSLIRLKEIGIKPIFLVGGATGFIGDPSGKSKERELLDANQLKGNVDGLENTIRKTVQNILLYLKDNKERLNLSYDVNMDFEVVNNLDFYKEMSAFEFVRDLGRHFRLSSLLSKDSVSTRLETQEGMSFMEFSYQLFQANDFLSLFKKKNCILQIGGSDQWGNIVNGCDLIHKVLGKGSFAITLPLLLTSAGKKFGKSEGNAIWIDSAKTNPRDLFQFLFNTSDSHVIDLLKKFTFYDIESIKNVEKEHFKEPEKRMAQKLLAETIIEMLNYEQNKEKPITSFQIFFETDFGKIKAYSAEEIRSHFRGVESLKINYKDLQQTKMKIMELVVNNKIKPSKSEVRRLATSGGFYINGKKLSIEETLNFDASDKLKWMGGSFMVLQFGKKEFHLLELI